MKTLAEFLGESVMDTSKYWLVTKQHDHAVTHIEVHTRGLFNADHVVGHATFMKNDDGTWTDYDTRVDAKHHRQGLATAMYKHVTQNLGLKLKASDKQTSMGAAFWKGFDPAGATNDGRYELYGRTVDHPKEGRGVIDYVGPKWVSVTRPDKYKFNVPRDELHNHLI